ncbi:hypothetical protein [Asticcacaulis excentricus]|uniref:Uncharacterized protein n=1 Tax=Asticcacaulis excentricus (strain ATCC 15261 / DSM 4724 / KCTC 12464 / NCIMB 9791 / VKM B-1370 / CB 48) TaxID=573065 RepID=E8RRJ5_ASTEC|nr:hypothetical protein [Asticcacaulis excentricus]ADU13440.1 hypothetical protein Astex_1774 [Asticcacaulis excentricus CB 48]
MTKLKTIATAVVAIAGLAAITPAFAAGQHDRYDRYDRREDVRDYRDNRVDARIERLEDRLDMGRRSGRLTRSEFGRLSSELNGIERLSNQYERSGRGIDRQEMANLSYRLDRFEQKLHWERNDRDTAWRR